MIGGGICKLETDIRITSHLLADLVASDLQPRRQGFPVCLL